MNITVVGVGTEFTLATQQVQMVITTMLPTGKLVRMVVHEADVPSVEESLQPFLGGAPAGEAMENQPVEQPREAADDDMPIPQEVRRDVFLQDGEAQDPVVEDASDSINWSELPDDVLPDVVKERFRAAGIPSRLPMGQLLSTAKEVIGQLQMSNVPPPVVYGAPSRTVPMDDLGYPIVNHPPATADDDEEAPQL